MELNQIFGLSYCINMDNRKDRWDACQKEFEKINFFPQRFSAIEDANPAVGCWKSHIAILKEAEQKKQNVLIFEDDVEFVGDKETLEIALKELFSDIQWWDMFYLGGNILKPFYQVTKHLARLTHCQSTHAYGVHYNFLHELIPFLETNKFIIDVLYAEGVVPLRNCYITIPMMAIQRADYSNIEKRVMTYDIPIQRYNRFLVKKGQQQWA